MIREFGTIRSEADFPSEQSSFASLILPSVAFDDLYSYVLESQNSIPESEMAFRVFTRQGRRHLTVKSFVGVLETRSGTILEILPKILDDDSPEGQTATKEVFVKMLRHLKSVNSIEFGVAHIGARDNFPLLETYIAHFLDLLAEQLRVGLQSAYVEESDNLQTLRGRQSTVANLRTNMFDRTKFFCEYSEYSVDNPLNRILKSTLMCLLRTTRIVSNRVRINTSLFYFDQIGPSQAVDVDLKTASSGGRNAHRFSVLVNWCRLILSRQGFVAFKGSYLNIAMLFPMERVFEDYVGHLVRKYADGYSVSTQDKKYFLVEKHLEVGRFGSRPDIVISSMARAEILIMDTKWKMLDEYAPSKNYNISQADMYQLYAYGKKYAGSANPRLKLIYPGHQSFQRPLQRFVYEGELEWEVIPFNFHDDPETFARKLLR